MNRRTWNPAGGLFLPLETDEPTEWDVIGLFDGADTDIAARFAVMAAYPHRRFQVLTDRLDRAAEWFVWFARMVAYQSERRVLAIAFDTLHPDDSIDVNNLTTDWSMTNLMIGTTITTQTDADEKLLQLEAIPTRWRFVHVESSEEIDLGIRIRGDSSECACGVQDARLGLDGQWRCLACGVTEPGSPFEIHLVEIAGGTGPEQLQLVQALARQVLDAQTWETFVQRNPAGGFFRLGPPTLVSGPALAIVQADVCPECLAKRHPDDELARHWGMVCMSCDGTGRAGHVISNPCLWIPEYGARVWNQGPVR